MSKYAYKTSLWTRAVGGDNMLYVELVQRMVAMV